MSFAGHSTIQQHYVRAIAGCILIAAIAGLLAGALGMYWASLDILAHFRGHLIGVAVISSLALVVPRFGLGILIAGFLAVPLAHAGLSNRVYLDDQTNAHGSAPRVKLVSLNMWGGHSDLERIGEFLQHVDADIVVLAEFSTEMRALLRRLKIVYPHQLYCSAGCRIALLSKRKWVKSGTQRRSDGKPRLAWATFSYGQKPLTVIGTHLRKPIDSPRRQAREIDWLAKQILRLPGAVVLAGDLNSTPWSHNFRRLTDVARLHRASGIYPTWPASFLLPPQLAIDHVLVSDGVTINQLRIGKRVSSDHLPVIAELSLTGH